MGPLFVVNQSTSFCLLTFCFYSGNTWFLVHTCANEKQFIAYQVYLIPVKKKRKKRLFFTLFFVFFAVIVCSLPKPQFSNIVI